MIIRQATGRLRGTRVAVLAVTAAIALLTGVGTRMPPGTTGNLARDTPIDTRHAPLPQAGVSIVEDPLDTSHLVAALNDYNAPQGTSLYVSEDAGSSWRAARLPRIPQQRMGDPRLAYGPRGLLYLAVTGYDVDLTTPEQTVHLSINLFLSRDGGHTWTWLGRPSGVPPQPPIGDDFPSLAVDPISGAITVAWTRIMGQHELIAVARSVDGGHSFSAPVLLPTHLGEGAATIVDRSGTAVVAFMDLEHNAIIVSGVRGSVRWSVRAAPLREVPPTLPGLRFRIESYPALAIDRRTGRLYLTWAVLANGHTRIAFTTSSDGGHHWSSLTDPGTASRTDFFMPTLAVSPAGIVGVMAYGRQGASYRVYAMFSTDCARHFAPAFAVDSVPSPLQRGGPPYLGDYAAIAIDRHAAHPAWTDNRGPVPVIYTRAMPIPAAGHC